MTYRQQNTKARHEYLGKITGGGVYMMRDFFALPFRFILCCCLCRTCKTKGWGRMPLYMLCTEVGSLLSTGVWCVVDCNSLVSKHCPLVSSSDECGYMCVTFVPSLSVDLYKKFPPKTQTLHVSVCYTGELIQR